jgi:iron(III) transport system permease protein
VLSGKGGERRPIALGGWQWAFLGYSLPVTLSVVLPYAVLAQAAFAKAWARGSAGQFHAGQHPLPAVRERRRQAGDGQHLHLRHRDGDLAVTLALLVAYMAGRRLVPFGEVLGVLCFAPFVIPGLVLAIGFYAAYAPPPLALAGTATILVLAFVTRFLPIAYANASAAIRGINPEMEDAVTILGGSRLVAIRRVVGPLLKRSLLGAWLLVFIPASREVSSALFLYGPNTRTMSVLFFDLTEGGNFEQLSALGVILLCTVLLFVSIGLRVVGRDFMLSKGSE